MEKRRRAYDLVLEDLSEPHPELRACKPWSSFEELPAIIHGKLRPEGAALFNLLPWTGARVIEFSDYENRVLVAGNSLESSAILSRKIGKALGSINSSLRGGYSLRTLKQD